MSIRLQPRTLFAFSFLSIQNIPRFPLLHLNLHQNGAKSPTTSKFHRLKDLPALELVARTYHVAVQKEDLTWLRSRYSV